ncbi:serine hydrolase [Aliidiomarina sanyensis]|uniref:Beta-lactamase n=1 Tax=Aliidiomarina sanyensis TaxID=1249555 RepID=A0A432WFS6_9GAMM|nr:serine hydrolase [Aliidiomarina sanyensis]RUO32676.1 hypothetical protein CWE11_07820 [Aliidiomarina sanyensis]
MKILRTRRTALWLCCIAGLSWSLPGIADNAPVPVQNAVEGRISGDMSGACIAAARIAPNQEGVLEVERGFACANAQTPLPDERSRFEIGSVSKTMLGALVAAQVREGELDINQTVASLLPDGVRFSDPRAESMTLAHLLTHTSGLPRLPSNLNPADVSDPYADYTEELLWEAVQTTELTTDPGEAFAYSNFAYMLLSQLVSEHAERSLSDLFEQTVFAPLGMTTASFSGETLPPTNSDGNGVANWHMPKNMEGVGAVRASLMDLENYVKGHLGEAPADVFSALQLSQTTLLSPGGRDLAWGWMIAPASGVNYVAHGGGTGGFTSMVAFDPQSRLGAVVLTNGALYQTGDIQLLALHLMDSTIPPGSPYRLPEQPEQLDLAQYEGVYPLLPGFDLRIFVQDGQLHIQGTGQPSAPVAYAEEDTFENRQFGARFVFERDAAGHVVSVVLHQGGQQLRGERQPLAD